MARQNDSKPIGMSVNHEDKKVIVQFDQVIGYLKMTPHEAMELAYAIYEHAQKAEGKTQSSIIALPRFVQ